MHSTNCAPKLGSDAQLGWGQLQSTCVACVRPQSLLNKEKKRIKTRCQVKEMEVVLRPQATQLARVTPLFWNVSPDPSLLEPPWAAGGWRKAPQALGEALSSVPSGKAASLPATSDLMQAVCALREVIPAGAAAGGAKHPAGSLVLWYFLTSGSSARSQKYH